MCVGSTQPAFETSMFFKSLLALNNCGIVNLLSMVMEERGLLLSIFRGQSLFGFEHFF